MLSNFQVINYHYNWNKKIKPEIVGKLYYDFKYF